MNRIIFQPDGKRMYPIFHCSIIPIVSEANEVPPAMGCFFSASCREKEFVTVLFTTKK